MPTDIPMNTLEHVVYGGTELNAFDVGDCNWRKPYNITIPAKPTGVAGITVARLASESNCGQLDTTSITANGTVLYGDTLSIEATAATGYNNPTASFTGGVITSSGPINPNTALYGLYFDITTAPKLFNGSSSIFENNTLIKTGEVTVTFISNGEEQSVILSKGLSVQNISDPPEPELVWQDYNWNNLVYNADTGIYTVDGVEYSEEEASAILGGNTTVVYRQYTDFWAGNGRPTGWLVDKLAFSPPMTALEVNEQDIWGSYIMSLNNKVVGDVAVSVAAGTGKTYYVRYNQGIATGGTLPATQSWTYPNAVTLATNSMTKSSATAATYTVTFNYNGSGVANTTTTVEAKTTYTADGWSTESSGRVRDYDDGESIQLADTITLYPAFLSHHRRATVTLPTPTRNGYTFKGWATSSTATSGATGSYTVTGNVTLYAIWSPGSTASVSIKFPAVPRQTVSAYTQTTGSNRIFQTSQETQYSGYDSYTSCTVKGVVDGVDVTGPYFVTVKEEGAALNNTIYKAKFTGGVLYVNTTVLGVGTPSTTSMILSAGAYNTTATFIGKPQLDVDQYIFAYGPAYNTSTSYIELALENWNPVAVTAYIEATFGDGSTAISTSCTIPANSTTEIPLGVSSSYGQDLGDVTVYYTDPTGTYLDSKTVTTYVS